MSRSPVAAVVVVMVTAAVIAARAVVGESHVPRGVGPDFAPLYDPSNPFNCLDGSSTISFSKVNDDYCDCRDGSDEPGTSACNNGKFYCRNKGFKPKRIPSSRVNDGICDCCDGSDEFEAPSCSNTCSELGREEREEAERLAKVLEEGLKAKEEMVQAYKVLKQQREQELAKKTVDLEAANAELEDKRKLKADAEALEQAALDAARAEEDRLKAQQEEQQRLEERQEAERVFRETLDRNGDGVLTAEELQMQAGLDQNNDGLVDPEEAKYYLAGHETYSLSEFDTFFDVGWRLFKPALFPETPSAGTDAGAEDYDDEEELAEGEAGGNDDDDDEDVNDGTNYREEPEQGDATAEAGGEAVEEELRPGPDGHLHAPDGHIVDRESQQGGGGDEGKPRQRRPRPPPSEVKHEEKKYDEETQKAIDSAEEARGFYRGAESTQRDVQATVHHLENLLSRDYGREGEFGPLADQCFEFTDQEYIYRMCAFGSCTQKPKAGGAETKLGQWESWVGPAEDPYEVMLYDKGLQCWNGPQRSARVHMRCGSSNALVSVSEPNRCEYAFVFETPASCKQEMYNSLNDNNNQHDEL